MMFDLRTELFTKLQQQEVAYYDHYPVGRTMTRLTSDVDALNELFTSGVIDVLGDLVIIFAIIGIMFWLDWKLALVSLVTVPLLLRRRTGSANTPATALTGYGHAMRGSTRFCRNTFPVHRPSSFLTPKQRHKSRFDEINDDYRNANIETIFYYSVFYPLVDFIGAVGIAVVIFAFGYEYHRRIFGSRARPDGRYLGVVYSVLAPAFSADPRPVGQIQRAAGRDRGVAPHLYSCSTATSRSRRRTNRKRRARRADRSNFKMSGSPIRTRTGCSRTFRSTSTSARVSRLSATRAPAKRPITNLLMRFYDVQKGRILLDGVDVRDWDLHDLRSNFAVVLQDVFLFSGSIENNIRLGNDDIDRDRVDGRHARCTPTNLSKRSMDGYESEVRERGAGLSVGQKQLISFARALAFDPTILILDEATSSIDTETEQLIQQAVERVMEGRTSLVVAHRLSTIQKCDRIIVLHHGELREIGHAQRAARPTRALLAAVSTSVFRRKASPSRRYSSIEHGVGSGIVHLPNKSILFGDWSIINQVCDARRSENLIRRDDGDGCPWATRRGSRSSTCDGQIADKAWAISRSPVTAR